MAKAPIPQEAEQLSLFLDEHVLLNGAMQDMNTLRLEAAKAGFKKYRDIYPGSECVNAQLKIIDHLLNGLIGLPGGGAGAAALRRLWHSCEDFAGALPLHDTAMLAARQTIPFPEGSGSARSAASFR
jgi:hypothetical protein